MASPMSLTRWATALVYTFASKVEAISSPDGSKAFDWATAAATSVEVRPRAWARAGFTMTLICRCRPPLIAALATPEIPSRIGSMEFKA
jgi:hypothetical protein